LDRVEIIQRAAADTQLNLYFLKERFFNIWYLMRVAPKGSQNKVIWLVRFLESWYDRDGLMQRAKQHMEAIKRGNYHPKAAYYLTEALAGTNQLHIDIEHQLINITREYLQEREKALFEDISPSFRELLYEAMKLYDAGEKDKAIKVFLKSSKGSYINLGNLYKGIKDYPNAEKYYLMAVNQGHTGAMWNMGNLYRYYLMNYKQAEKYFLMAVEKGHSDAMFSLGNFYETDVKDYVKAEKYYLMAIKNNSLYTVFAVFGLANIYIWNNQFDNAIQIVKEVMYSKDVNEEIREEILSYISLLLAKQQYQYVAQYFEDPELNLKERFKPLYYALLHFTDNKDFHKMPPELAEPVKDIIEKVKQMAVDYA